MNRKPSASDAGPRTRRSFSHAERVTALLMLESSGASIRATARQLGLPETTLRRWANGQRSPTARRDAPSHRLDLADTFARAASLCLGGVLDKVGKATLLQRAKAFAIAFDRMMVLESRPTPAPPVVINAADLTPAQWMELADIFHKSAALGCPLVAALSAPHGG